MGQEVDLVLGILEAVEGIPLEVEEDILVLEGQGIHPELDLLGTLVAEQGNLELEDIPGVGIPVAERILLVEHILLAVDTLLEGDILVEEDSLAEGNLLDRLEDIQLRTRWHHISLVEGRLVDSLGDIHLEEGNLGEGNLGNRT